MPDNKPHKLDMDLINMVQNARMMHDNEATPSKISDVYWIEAKREKSPTLTTRTGEWRIETTLDEVDNLWAKIKAATEAGQLGYKSKVSTYPAQGQSQRDQRLICVRTYDADDSEDIERIKKALEAMGIGAMKYVRD